MEFTHLVPALSTLRRIAAAPLTWFLIFGGVLFALDNRFDRVAPPTITISNGDLQRLRDQWHLQTGRETTASELDALLAELILERRLATEARALGLHIDDVVVQRRLAQKLRFLKQDPIDQDLLSEHSLQRYFANNADKYMHTAVLSFRHIYLDNEIRGDNLHEDAERILESLSADANADWQRLGDQFLPGRTFTAMSDEQIRNEFGAEFLGAISQLQRQRWSGPIRSGHGAHIVIVDKFDEERRLSFANARQRVVHDIRSEQRAQSFKEFRLYLEDKYPVVIERDSESAASETMQ